jgi:hypothetical protein
MLFPEFNEQGVTASRFELLDLDTRGCAADAHSASDNHDGLRYWCNSPYPPICSTDPVGPGQPVTVLVLESGAARALFIPAYIPTGLTRS